MTKDSKFTKDKVLFKGGWLIVSTSSHKPRVGVQVHPKPPSPSRRKEPLFRYITTAPLHQPTDLKTTLFYRYNIPSHYLPTFNLEPFIQWHTPLRFPTIMGKFSRNVRMFHNRLTTDKLRCPRGPRPGAGIGICPRHRRRDLSKASSSYISQPICHATGSERESSIIQVQLRAASSRKLYGEYASDYCIYAFCRPRIPCSNSSTRSRLDILQNRLCVWIHRRATGTRQGQAVWIGFLVDAGWNMGTVREHGLEDAVDQSFTRLGTSIVDTDH